MSTGGRSVGGGGIMVPPSLPISADHSLATTPINDFHADQSLPSYFPPGSVDAYERVAQVGEGTYGYVSISLASDNCLIRMTAKCTRRYTSYRVPWWH